VLAADLGDEGPVAGGRLDPVRVDDGEHAHRVVARLLPQRPVEAAEDLEGGPVPAPAEVLRQLAQRRQRLGQRRRALGRVERRNRFQHGRPPDGRPPAPGAAGDASRAILSEHPTDGPENWNRPATEERTSGDFPPAHRRWSAARPSDP
jgi:hypothetical protein